MLSALLSALAASDLTGVVQFLTDRGAKIDVWNKKNKTGLTPVVIAEGHRPGLNFRPSPETVAALHRVNSLRIRLIRLDRVILDADVLLPAMEEHLALIAALRSRDPRLAVAAMEAHLNHARNRALGL